VTTSFERIETMTGPQALALTQPPLMRYWDRPRPGDWAKVLATFPLFSGVSRRHLRKLVEKARFVEFANGVDGASTVGDRRRDARAAPDGNATAIRPAARSAAAGHDAHDAQQSQHDAPAARGAGCVELTTRR
jgi:hypothetical protein